MNAKVKCPTCEKTVEWTPEARWRPFCSERCKLLDLGDWFDETNKVSGPSLEDESDAQAWTGGMNWPPRDERY